MFRKKKAEKTYDGRIGWINTKPVGQGWANKGQVYNIWIRVQEIAAMDNMSRVRVIELVGAEPGILDNLRDFYDNNWIEQKLIRWEDDASSSST